MQKDHGFLPEQYLGMPWRMEKENMQENVKTNSYGTGNVNSKISYFRDSAILDFGTQSFSRVCKVFFHLSSTAATTLRAYDLAMAYVQGRYCKKTGLEEFRENSIFSLSKMVAHFFPESQNIPTLW